MKTVPWIAGLIFAPLVVLSAELFLSEHFKFGPSAALYFIGLSLALVPGIYYLWRRPASVVKRVWMSIGFVVVGIPALMFYTLWFGCIVFGDCL